MAIPSDITVANLVTEALKRAGRTNPTAGQITDATSYQFREVKADIISRSARQAPLLTTGVDSTVDGLQRYPWPTPANEVSSVTLLDGPDEYRGTAQAGAATTITLAATFDNSSVDSMKGKYLVTTGGTGVDQIRQVTGWNNSTKVATIDSAWTTNPDATTTYLVATDHRVLWDLDHATEWSTYEAPSSRGKSFAASMHGRELWLQHTPDKIYGLWWSYWAHLDRLDESTSTVLLRHIRDYLSLWMQGLAVKLDQRYDEDRYQTEYMVYQTMLAEYGKEGGTLRLMQFTDV